MRRLARVRLATQVVRQLRKAGFKAVRYDARAFEVRFAPNIQQEPSIIDLAPLLAKSRKQVKSYLSGLTANPVPPTWQLAQPLLRPVLRGGTPGTPLSRPALPYLFEYVVIDHPEAMTYVTGEQIDAWAVRPDEVFAAARSNLAGATLKSAPTEVVRFVDDGDAYWSSHLLLQHWLERLTPQVDGPPLAFVPERGTLLVTSATSPHLRALFAQAEELYARSARPITPMAYVSDANGCTVPYTAGPGHPLHHVVQRAQAILAVQEYARQATHLTEPAAELEVVGDDGAGWRTRAAWDEKSLLPTADEVIIGDRTIPWSELAPRLEPVTGLNPIRWQRG